MTDYEDRLIAEAQAMSDDELIGRYRTVMFDRHGNIFDLPDDLDRFAEVEVLVTVIEQRGLVQRMVPILKAWQSQTLDQMRQQEAKFRRLAETHPDKDLAKELREAADHLGMSVEKTLLIGELPEDLFDILYPDVP